MATILLVEDDVAVNEVIEQHLTETGHQVVAAHGTNDAMAMLDGARGIDLMLVDLVMPSNEPDGLAFAETAQAAMPGVPIIFLTAYYGFVARAGDLPGSILYKPVDLDELTREIASTLAA